MCFRSSSTWNQAKRQALGKDLTGSHSWVMAKLDRKGAWGFKKSDIYNEIFIHMWRVCLTHIAIAPSIARVCSTFIVVANTKGLRSNTHAPNTLIHDYALTLTQMAVMRGSGWVVDIIRITRTTSDSNLRLLEVNQHSYAGKLPDALTLRYIYTIGRNNSVRRLLSMKIWIWII